MSFGLLSDKLLRCRPLGVGAVLLAAVGCSSQHSEPAGGRTAAPRASALLASADLRLPIEEYLFSDAETGRVRQAQQTLIERCARRFGLTYEPVSADPPVGPRSVMDRRYGLTDAKLARADGYHLGDRDPRIQKTEEFEAPTGKMLTVLTGKPGDSGGDRVNGAEVPAGGCAGEAGRKLSEDGILGSSDAAQDLNGKSFSATKEDPRVLAVFRSWSRCMKDKGFSYPDPLTVMNDSRFQGQRSNPLEIRTAVADVACKGRVNLVGIWFAVEVGYQKSLIAENRKDLAPVLQGKRHQLEAADAVNSSG
ncbi:hypothetical protein [Streptomyces sp. JHA26]|uniref:hypothetical protein n=1 Tax=Streptomyces sp. JHA26 TaxID=1917143 RepID=UPI00098A5DEF|nr:hypothetical protein [Streptomyces sp. JHA26]